MTEKRIRRVADIKKVWNKIADKKSLPIFRIKINKDTQALMDRLTERGLFTHRLDEGEHLLICKRDVTFTEPIFAFYVLSEGLANFGFDNEEPIFYILNGKKLCCQRNGGQIKGGLELIECSYTGQNYVDGETLMMGDITLHGNVTHYKEVSNSRESVKSSEFAISKLGLEELLMYPGIIMGHYYFYTENCNDIDLSANRKGGYPTRRGAKCAAFKWIRENI